MCYRTFVGRSFGFSQDMYDMEHFIYLFCSTYKELHPVIFVIFVKVEHKSINSRYSTSVVVDNNIEYYQDTNTSHLSQLLKRAENHRLKF